ncbi:intracellular sulfur oxidation DsrE/DsrF family protein [Methanofollis sp. W23]|uniref:DsrE family protein n=1 Tax=Methanofollis sp. W23 TaxID=2817849 RepID=UPI001AE76B47|nr:DsrE family protein [Methanofollis sp. W23]MBP2146304.1 intracellular sulfur oxidation DsrE/DsrF family protein [Methanofollis sp. W23]
MKKWQAVFHLTEAGKGERTVQNVTHLIEEWGDEVAVEVVANGDGIKSLLMTGPYGDQVRDLAGAGVRFAVCARSARALGFTREDFPRVVAFVPSGVGEIVRREAEGYAYIRP